MLFGFIQINTYVILSFITAFVIFNLALVIFLGNKKESYTQAFALGSFFLAVWAILIGLDLGATHTTPNHLSILFFRYIERSTYYLGLIIASCFFYFCYCFPVAKQHAQKILWSFITFTVAVIPLFFFTNLIIDQSNKTTEPILVYKTGSLSFLYTTIFAGLFITGLFFVFKKARTEQDPTIKKHLTFMFWSLVIGFVPPAITGIILPSMGIVTYPLIFLAMLSNNLWAFLVAYTIIKYKQMNVRVVTSEILILTMIFVLFISIFI